VNIVGRDIASVEGFNYSNALQNVEAEQWTPQELDAWLTNPREYAPGTTMSYQGLRDAEDRANLLTYLYELQQ
ncbi:c-type cytochrome, partial [Citreimonas sp.]|uniref:c-type cytochrome n=1 Tax=Citreimonas sp. TaxID=3036715 RepID=UPI0035C80988